MRNLLALAVIGVMTYAIIDCVRTEDNRARLGLPAWVWVVLILLLPGVGAVVWLVVSRMQPRGTQGGGDSSWSPSRGPRRPLAPDDDPEFLAELERRNRPTPAPRPAPEVDRDDARNDDARNDDVTNSDDGDRPPDAPGGTAPGQLPPDRA
ncbi:MAG: PLDc_N domain-containing protein [Actinomycetales bacterium]|nr:PLDc_N domain-containing protein [Actinomycetales bacterium]